MNETHTQELFEQFPNLYAGHTKSPRENLMCFGFECGDGWFELIKTLSEKLEPLGVVAVQVKEKFGTLRFYIDSGSDEVCELIDQAEEASGRICELCGQVGRVCRRMGWVKTLCATCAKEHGYGYREEAV